MGRLYQYGYHKARSGHFWQTSPPSPTSRSVARRSPGGIMGRVAHRRPLWAGVRGRGDDFATIGRFIQMIATNCQAIEPTAPGGHANDLHRGAVRR
jgi:hypothetical protein